MPVASLEEIQSKVGTEIGVSDWILVDQDRIDRFADVTEDRQFIHVDPDAAAKTLFRGTIAHGFLTLSMLTHLSSSMRRPEGSGGGGGAMTGMIMGVNYGFDKVRFINPVKVGSKIRASGVTKSVELKEPNAVQTTRTLTVEIEGEDKPALVADWITRVMFS